MLFCPHSSNRLDVLDTVLSIWGEDLTAVIYGMLDDDDRRMSRLHSLLDVHGLAMVDYWHFGPGEISTEDSHDGCALAD